MIAEKRKRLQYDLRYFKAAAKAAKKSGRFGLESRYREFIFRLNAKLHPAR